MTKTSIRTRLGDAADHINAAYDELDGNPNQALAAIAAATRHIERATDLAVQHLRDNGASWADIADALGIARQTAHQRFRDAPGA